MATRLLAALAFALPVLASGVAAAGAALAGAGACASCGGGVVAARLLLRPDGSRPPESSYGLLCAFTFTIARLALRVAPGTQHDIEAIFAEAMRLL